MTETTTDTAALHMVQFWLSTRRMTELARMLRLPLRDADTAYLVHCALGELFGSNAPSLFYVDDEQRGATRGRDGRFIRVLGYTELGREPLEEIARAFASPAVFEICDFSRMSSKPMPTHFSPGMHLGFELRACPVVRKSADGQSPSGQKRWRRGQELDAFVARSWELDDPEAPLEREAVYRDWLTAQFERSEAAIALRISMDRFSLERMLRRSQAGSNERRKANTVQRPAVTFSGELEVKDAQKFAHLLRQGIGRHKSFGFGMLKVRRA